MRLTIESDREDDGRWIAEALELPGVMYYGASREEAIRNTERLAAEVIANRIAHGKLSPTALAGLRSATVGYRRRNMVNLDWSKCEAVESIPGKVSGAWLFRGTRVPVSAIFENLKSSPLDEVLENFPVTRQQVQTVLDFAAQSAQSPLDSHRAA